MSVVNPADVPRNPRAWHQVFVLAGDIGGTNSRLCMYDMAGGPAHQAAAEGQGGVVVYSKVYSNADFKSFLEIVKKFLAEAGGYRPRTACFAVAGPVRENVVVLTNIANWRISGNELESQLGIDRVRIVNDFSAVGYGLLTLEDDECEVLNVGVHKPEAPIFCIGAGTGLGECYLTFNSEHYEVYPSEGGHSDFPARDPLEVELASFIRTKHNLTEPRISAERVVCGNGIADIYDFLRIKFPADANQTVSAKFDQASVKDKPAVVTTSTSQCPLADRALTIFLTAYGSEVGNCALKFLPRGGIYIAGGIMPKLIDRVKVPDNVFIKGVLSKGRMSDLVKEIQIKVVKEEFIGLRGAKLVAARELNKLATGGGQNSQRQPTPVAVPQPASYPPAAVVQAPAKFLDLSLPLLHVSLSETGGLVTLVSATLLAGLWMVLNRK